MTWREAGSLISNTTPGGVAFQIAPRLVTVFYHGRAPEVEAVFIDKVTRANFQAIDRRWPKLVSIEFAAAAACGTYLGYLNYDKVAIGGWKFCSATSDETAGYKDRIHFGNDVPCFVIVQH
ncbi:hypothetical protein Tco_0492587 [Tanacetum coccineum]